MYKLFPDYQDASSWRRRARIMVFGCIKSKSGKDLQNQLKKYGCAKYPKSRNKCLHQIYDRFERVVDVGISEEIYNHIM